MKHKVVSTTLSRTGANNLSLWEEVILEAKQRIAALKRSIRTFESLRDEGMEFPEPKKRRSRKQSEASQ
jgi:hypothetical protein